MPDKVRSFPRCDDHQHGPEIVPVAEPRESAFLGRATKAREGAQCHVFFVGRGARRRLQLFPSQADQAVKVTIPESLGSGLIAGFELIDPPRDRIGGRHERLFPNLSHRAASALRL
jgi:hypothetical protein